LKRVGHTLMIQPERFMKNTYKLIWSDEALNNLKGIIDYLEYKWTNREIKKFVQLLDKQLKLIKENPFLFSESEKSNGLRKSVLSRQTTIYYRIIDYEIRIITLFDNRQNPNRLIVK
jgi:plasmid stabilization system protein ParE